MTPFGQLQLWWRQATRTERQLSISAFAAVIALLVWLVAPAGSTGGTPAASGLTTSAGSASPGQPNAPVSVPGPGQPSGLEPRLPGVGVSPGAHAPGLGAGPAGPSAPQPLSTNGGGSGSGPSGQQPLTASDRGVTPTSIRLGFTVLSIGSVRQAGIVANLRTDMQQVIAAYADDANRNGGVHGRKIIPDIKTVDVINSNDQQAKCVEFTQNDKVFSILDTGWFILPSARSCIAVDNKTPLIGGAPGGAAEVQRARGYLIGTAKDDNRQVKDTAYAAKALGFFAASPGFKLGIIDDGCEPPVINDSRIGFKAYLKQVGMTSWDEFTFSCTFQDQQSQVPQAVLQMHSDSVTHIMAMTNIKTVESFMQTAQGQGYKPRYFLSDFGHLTHPYNATPDQFPPAQADGSLGVSEWNQGDIQAVPAVKTCSKILQAHGLPPITDWLHDFEAISLCDAFTLFLRASRSAGAQLTRSGFVQAAQVSGRYQFGLVHESNYNAVGHATGGDLIAGIKLDSNGCGCFRLVGRYHAGYG